MKRYVLTTDIKDDPDTIQKYRDYHAAVWPEVTESLKNVGFGDARIYILGRRLMLIMDTDDDFDLAEAGRIHRETHPRIKEWEELMDSFQERPAGTSGDGKWAVMEQLWELG